MRVLITGGAGFLGINLVRHLLSKGVTHIVSLDTAPFDYPEAAQVTVVRGDIRDAGAVARATAGCTVVVHSAAALPLYSPDDIHTTDVVGTRLCLAAARSAGVERFIHISTTAVYGIPDHHPLREDDPLDGVGPYGRAKIEAEDACAEFRAGGLCVPVLRPKTFIGPERLGVFSLLYDWAADGRNVPLIGSGRNRYQLLDVADLCEAIWLCATEDRDRVNSTFNIGAADFATLVEDCQAVLDHAGRGKRVIPFPAAPVVGALRVLEALGLSPIYPWVYETITTDSFVSIERAREALGFQPRHSNRDALVRNFQWYLEHRSSFQGQSGTSHRVPWKQGALGLAKRLF